MMIQINMPKNVKQIIHVLNRNGFEAYIVGGCVRDAVLGRQPDDWDITTSAKPEEVKAVFNRTVDTGIQHGTVTVMLKNPDSNELEGYEVTTYRVDGKYENHRKPAAVTFTASLIEDMKRRDFTINAMAYNDNEGLIDNFDGIGDLERGVIRCVGEPSERFDEDALRILRGVRFAAQLDFAIDKGTQEAIRAQAGLLKDISAERIQTELNKLLLSAHPERIRTAYELGVTKVVLPEFDAMMVTAQNHKHHQYTVGEHTIHVMEKVSAVRVMRWAALLHDVAKPVVKTTDESGDHFYGHNEAGEHLAEEIMKRLKFDNDTISRVKRLVYWHDYGMGQRPSISSFRKGLNKMGADLFLEYAELKRADILAQSDFMQQEKLGNLDCLMEYYEEIMKQAQCLTVKDLAVTGKDLIAQGMKPGREMGEMLAYLLDCVLEEPEKNEQDTLLALAKKKKAGL